MSNDYFDIHDSSIPGHRVAVAIAATLSLTATSLLLIYVAFLFILSSLKTEAELEATPQQKTFANNDKSNTNLHRPTKKNVESIQRIFWLQSWARHRLTFIKTPFGIMFMNLVLADFIQALGFGINYYWVDKSHCHDGSCQTTCTVQGVLIQLGDVASAFSNLMIAIQTFAILTFSWYLPNWTTWASLALIWVPVCVLGLAAPSIMGNWSGSHPFYAWAGDWCWISDEFSPLRLFLHYLWIFVSAFASIALYGHLFLRLQIHFRRSKVHHGKGLLGGRGKTGSVSSDMADGPVLPLQGDHLRKKLERKARAMLMYPIAFIFMILPLSAYRLASLAGHDWGITAASICGSMYCLSGFIDVVLFGTTRSILSVPVLSVTARSRGGTAVIGTNGIGMNSSALSGSATRSAAFRVEVVQETVIDLDGPSDSEGKTTDGRPVEVNGGGNEVGGNSQNANAKIANHLNLMDTNLMRNPMVEPIRASHSTISNTRLDMENRHPSLTVFSSDLAPLSHPAPTDPTPWYEPFP